MIDRDYGVSNQDRWDRPETRLFRLAAHEVENHLLIAPALASSRSINKRLGVERIEELAIEAARGRCWYETCRIVLVILRTRFRDGFITDPPQVLPNLEAAKRHLCDSDWFRLLASNVAETTVDHISEMLEVEYARTCTRLDNGSWRQEFSGKEIFRKLVSHIRSHQLSPGITPRQVEIDIAADVAAWQREQRQVPAELATLRASLRTRVGLA